MAKVFGSMPLEFYHMPEMMKLNVQAMILFDKKLNKMLKKKQIFWNHYIRKKKVKCTCACTVFVIRVNSIVGVGHDMGFIYLYIYICKIKS